MLIRRTHGLGFVAMATLPPCSSVNVQPGFVGPVECDPSEGGAWYPASQSQVADLSQWIQDLQATPAAAPSYLPWIVGGAAFLLLLVLVGGRR